VCQVDGGRAVASHAVGVARDPPEHVELAVEYGIFGICEEWPVEQAGEWVKEPLVSDIPTLLLAGEFDPVTPPEFAQLVAGHLSNRYYYLLPGAGHIGDNTSECALSITASFIEDPTNPPDSSCIAAMPGLVFDIPSEASEVTWEPYSNEELGLRGVVPAGWTEVDNGLFVRSSTALDMAAMQIAAEAVDLEEMLVLLTTSYDLQATPEMVGERQANGLTWSLYAFEIQGMHRDVALAESTGGTLLLVVRSAPAERDEIYEAVFLPMVDALVPLP